MGLPGLEEAPGRIPSLGTGLCNARDEQGSILQLHRVAHAPVQQLLDDVKVGEAGQDRQVEAFLLGPACRQVSGPEYPKFFVATGARHGSVHRAANVKSNLLTSVPLLPNPAAGRLPGHGVQT